MGGNGMDTFKRLDVEKRERILDAAAGEFACHGFHKASVNRIVGAIGIAKGSLFKYFGTKQGLFEYLFERALERVKAPLKEVRTQTEGQDFFLRLHAVAHAAAGFAVEHPRAYRIYLKMLFQEDFPLRDRVLQALRDEFADFLGPMVDAAVEAGELRADVPRDAVVFHIQAVIDRLLQGAQVPGLDGGLDFSAPRALAERLDEQLCIIRYGLAAKEQQ